MRYLVATDSVHTTAAACDYLEDCLAQGDSVVVVTIPGRESRDAEDALNVANARVLGLADVETRRLDADASPSNAILDAAEELDVDVIVLGTHAGMPDAEQSLGSTTSRVAERADVPVVVVPLAL